MTTHLARAQRIALLLMLIIALVALSSTQRADTGTCGGQMLTLPFTDVPSSNIFFCAIAEAYFSGMTNGTSPTTYSPSSPVTREQMAAFVTRTLDQSLNRGSRRAALNIRWNAETYHAMDSIPMSRMHRVQSDGADLWVSTDSTLQRVRASDGTRLEEYTGVTSQGRGVLVAGSLVFVVGRSPGKLYFVHRHGHQDTTVIEYSTVPDSLPNFLDGIAFDGLRLWIGSQSGAITLVRIDTRDASIVTTGFTQPRNLIYDGTKMWASDFGSGNLFKLDSNGAILQTVAVGSGPLAMAFDGTNIWVPNYLSNSVSVVRAVGGLAGTVLATLTGNGLDHPSAVAFDGERMLVTNEDARSISLFRATDLAPIVSVPSLLEYKPVGACSDGLNFWITSIHASVSAGARWRY